MRALVTGGAGFIGSHLVDALVAAGEEVIVVDHLQRGHTANLAGALEAGVRIARADVTDVSAMTALFREVEPDVLFHLAAQIDVRRSVADPSTDAHVNVGGTASVLEAARHSGTRRAILASTAGVYGDPAALPVAEDAPMAPLSPYGASKAAAETYMALFSRLHGISTLSLRLANAYGPRQDPHGESGVVAIFAAADGPVTVYGDGDQTRDYVYVADVVAAFLAAAGSDIEGALNISTGVETTVLDLVHELELDARFAPSRPGDVRRSCLDPSLARERLGWSARFALADGLGRMRAAAFAV